MAQGNTTKEVRSLMIPKVKEIFQKYKQHLKEGRVPLADLIFTKVLSKNFDAYSDNNTTDIGAIHQLEDEGKSLCRTDTAVCYNRLLSKELLWKTEHSC
jgi:DNA polymerase elongation subunit (family B)